MLQAWHCFAYVALVTGGRWSRERLRRYLRAGVSLALSSLSGVGLAASPEARQAEPFRLVWSSSAGCGNARTFLAELEGRTALLREARTDEHAITLIVETFRAETGVRGQLTVRKPDGQLTVREVPGQNCQEVESAMALIAALMVDPLAGTSERAAAGRPVEPSRRTPQAVPASSEAAWSFRVDQRLTARTAVAPRLTWGQALGVTLTGEASEARPSLGLSVQVADATTSGAHGSAELEWAAAQLTLCPIGVGPGKRWDFRACAALQLGRLRGIGFETASPAQRAIFWASAGVQLEGRYQLIGPLWLGWEGALALPFSRERFYLEPQETLHRVPWWALSFGFGAGLRFF